VRLVVAELASPAIDAAKKRQLISPEASLMAADTAP
jgi:hypothetical protein